jgi:hypothetical protein
MNSWSSFSAGALLGTAIWAALWLTMPPVQKEWRQCAPAQDGEALVSTVQLKDRTECNYVKKPTGRTVQRKKVVS